ncbi:hypothetical protein [Spirosoma flavum]|uniref:TonB-dependent receptor n=1 Tax=Spirosoma flavum TaxID=2048557 RepID=A0ABW6ABV4_9BACT
MTSKDPFRYQGLSVQTKVGVNHVNDSNTGAAIYQDYGLRYAKAFSNRLAVKLVASYMKGLDWFATDYTDVDATTLPEKEGLSNPAYNGLNVYGDEVNRTITGIGKVSRMDYLEKDLTDYTVYSLKLNGAVHYRITPKLEAIYSYNFAKGTANYTGCNRFSVNGFYVPTLFPASIRATATGFCFNVGRLFTATTVLFVGALTIALGGIGNALLVFSAAFMVAFGAVWFKK